MNMNMNVNMNTTTTTNNNPGIIAGATDRNSYTRSPLQDSRLFGPRPWKILATTYEKKDS